VQEGEVDVTVLEVDVAVSEFSEQDRLYEQLCRAGDAVPGHRVQMIEGNIVMSPLRPHHGETIWEVWSVLKKQLPKSWGLTNDVAFFFDDENMLCPDIAVIPRAEIVQNLSMYAPDLIELAVEVVSPSSVRHDYEVKNRAYAAAGIPNYLIFDPYQACCTTLWNPAKDGYLGRDQISYGTPVTVKLSLGTFTIETDELPVDPKHT
jgi:Uma2 family endonuclease